MTDIFCLQPDPEALKEIMGITSGSDLELSYAAKLYLEENPSFLPGIDYAKESISTDQKEVTNNF